MIALTFPKALLDCWLSLPMATAAHSSWRSHWRVLPSLKLSLFYFWSALCALQTSLWQFFKNLKIRTGFAFVFSGQWSLPMYCGATAPPPATVLWCSLLVTAPYKMHFPVGSLTLLCTCYPGACIYVRQSHGYFSNDACGGQMLSKGRSWGQRISRGLVIGSFNWRTCHGEQTH